ncbi:MAG: 2-hydroxychromene-2-carboxylate isomerase [Alphaproteobacteria bacterium]|nr:2-hydroxychromene-2-carboxylate isomerase [Alphaproteobacteria bacterium]
MPDIEYFYSAHSAYAYLGSARLMAIARAAGRRIVHRPVDLDRVLDGAGSVPFAKRTRAQRAYFFATEIQRWSRYRNAPVMDGRPTHHDNSTALAHGMLIAGVQQGIDVDRLAHAMLEAHWSDDADLADRTTLAGLGRGIRLDSEALLEHAQSPEILAILEANTEEAIARSVFGSPTYFIDGDMYYGQDRLELIEHALRQSRGGT